MKSSEYQELYRKLATPEDIDFLSENFGYDKELLLVIHTQRVTRDTTRKFYRVKNQANRLAYQWDHGESFLSIARRFEFPPVLMALMILEQMGTNRKTFWKYFTDAKMIPSARLRQEIDQIRGADIIYSPEGTETQYARGRWGEAQLKDWLVGLGAEYRTEAQIRGEFDKTPDALLRTPIEWQGTRYFWVESKALVGDAFEVKRHLKKQLIPYTQLFGDGLVIYWFGYVEDGGVEIPGGITVIDDRHVRDPAFRPIVPPPLPEGYHRDRAPPAPQPA